MLVAIPAFSEQASGEVAIRPGREALRALDLLVVDDGSSDEAEAGWFC